MYAGWEGRELCLGLISYNNNYTSCTPRVRRERCLSVLPTGFVNPSFMKFNLVLRPLLTKPLCGRGLDMSQVGKVRVRCFFYGVERNTLRMQKQCVLGPLPALWEGPVYETIQRTKWYFSFVTTDSDFIFSVPKRSHSTQTYKKAPVTVASL